jgi:dGTPase
MAAVQALDRPIITFSGRMAGDIATIKRFLFTRMYRHWRVNRMRIKAGLVVRELFTIFMADPGVLPDSWRAACAAARAPQDRARVVADYIAGMTDRFALEEHRHLTDPATRA